MAEDALNYAKVAPYLTVDEGAKAIDFYKLAFGAQERDRYEWHGKIGHVGLTINGSDVMLSDEPEPEYAEIVGTRAPRTLGGTTSTINLAVEDVDHWHARAVEAGCTSLREPKDEFYGRQGKVRDPFGHVWGFVGPTKG